MSACPPAVISFIECPPARRLALYQVSALPYPIDRASPLPCLLGSAPSVRLPAAWSIECLFPQPNILSVRRPDLFYRVSACPARLLSSVRLALPDRPRLSLALFARFSSECPPPRRLVYRVSVFSAQHTECPPALPDRPLALFPQVIVLSVRLPAAWSIECLFSQPNILSVRLRL